MTLPPSAWPKPYLLELYERTIADGCIRVQLNNDFARFKSLKAAFYRLRRRVDSQHDVFIKESYHLCAISWEADRGTALITYDKLPDGVDLPEIESVTSRHMPAHTEGRPAPLGPIDDEPAQQETTPFDSSALVESLMRKVGSSIDEDALAAQRTDELE